MATTVYTIGTGTDDAVETGGTMNLTASLTNHDHDATTEWSGLRFNSVVSGSPVTQGATITSMIPGFVIASASGDQPLVTFFGEKTIAPATFAATASNISGRTMTTASVAWSSADLGAGTNTTHSGPDLATIGQEIVNLASWTGPFCILIQGGNDAARNLQYRMYEYTGTGGTDPAGTYAPTLTVTWTDPAASGQPMRLRRLSGLAIPQTGVRRG